MLKTIKRCWKSLFGCRFVQFDFNTAEYVRLRRDGRIIYDGPVSRLPAALKPDYEAYHREMERLFGEMERLAAEMKESLQRAVEEERRRPA